MRKVLIILAGTALLLVLSLPAAAQHGQGGGRSGAARQGPPQPIPTRNAGAHNQGQPRDARMTPQEREQLRRDVHDHGRDIYRERRGRPAQ